MVSDSETTLPNGALLIGIRFDKNGKISFKLITDWIKAQNMISNLQIPIHVFYYTIPLLFSVLTQNP